MGGTRRVFTTFLVAGVLLTACSSARNSQGYSDGPVQTNPLIPTRPGLFGESQRAYAERDPTTPIATISALTIERVPGGAILRAQGVDSVQGAFFVELVPANEDEVPVDGVLSYTLERALPEQVPGVGPVQTREVVVARHLTDQQLRGVSRIRVAAAQNVREISRR